MFKKFKGLALAIFLSVFMLLPLPSLARETVMIDDIGEVTGPVAYSRYTTLNALVTALGATPTTVILNRTLTADTVSVPATVDLEFKENGRISINLGQTVTIDSPDMIKADMRQQVFEDDLDGIVFTAAGTVSIMWFGGETNVDSTTALAAAIDSVTASRGTVYIPKGNFLITASNYLPGRVGILGEELFSSILRFTTVGSDGFTVDGASDDAWLSNLTLAAPQIHQTTGFAVHIIAGGTFNLKGFRFKGAVNFAHWTEPIILVDNGLQPFECDFEEILTANISPVTYPYIVYWDVNGGPANHIGLLQARSSNAFNGTDAQAIYLYNPRITIDRIQCYDGIRRAVFQRYGHVEVGNINFEPLETVAGNDHTLVDSVGNPPSEVYFRNGGGGSTIVERIRSSYTGTLDSIYSLGNEADNCWLGPVTHGAALGINHVQVSHAVIGNNNYYHGLYSEITYTLGSDTGLLKCFDGILPDDLAVDGFNVDPWYEQTHFNILRNPDIMLWPTGIAGPPRYWASFSGCAAARLALLSGIGRGYALEATAVGADPLDRLTISINRFGLLYGHAVLRVRYYVDLKATSAQAQVVVFDETGVAALSTRVINSDGWQEYSADISGVVATDDITIRFYPDTDDGTGAASIENIQLNFGRLWAGWAPQSPMLYEYSVAFGAAGALTVDISHTWNDSAYKVTLGVEGDPTPDIPIYYTMPDANTLRIHRTANNNAFNVDVFIWRP